MGYGGGQGDEGLTGSSCQRDRGRKRRGGVGLFTGFIVTSRDGGGSRGQVRHNAPTEARWFPVFLCLTVEATGSWASQCLVDIRVQMAAERPYANTMEPNDLTPVP